MLKRFLLFLILALILSYGTYALHTYLLSSYGAEVGLSISGIYIFHTIAMLVVCLLIEAMNSIMPSQAGYAYLASIFIKIGLFVLIFHPVIFTEEGMNMAEKLSVVLPMMIFIIIEAIYCGRLLNSQQIKS
ncbi:DUF6168 family protein [Fulvivirga ligni]|uniref:DUF6168 family protein n=1 Tax=Fulvivirga ligni TaxID=2904246 RepID=UPI001F46B460|nr:DUF6168 family protein [Fulvivirga ligni]UII22035.1 DUF6168 family protein [Fulvivirga ligni]